MNIRAFLPAFLMCGIFFMQTQMTGAANGAILTFPLNYTESNDSLAAYLPISLKQEIKFRKEPDFANHQVMRGALQIGSKPEDYLGFAVDRTSWKLYLDLNRNLDLTDDPDGVFKKEQVDQVNLFRNIRITLRKDGIDRSYLFEMYPYSLDSCQWILKSSFRGEIDLYGQKWRMEAQDDIEGLNDPLDRYTIRLTPDGNEGGRLPALFHSKGPDKNLFLGGRLYRVAFKIRSGSVMKADFIETRCALGELLLEGQWIRRVILNGNASVLLDSPGDKVMLPVDNYRIQSVFLKTSTYSFHLAEYDRRLPEIAVSKGKSNHLKLGGPLRNSVTVKARGDVLRLHYQLLGGGGEPYAIENSEGSKPPEFAIYKGDHRIAAGTLQFG